MNEYKASNRIRYATGRVYKVQQYIIQYQRMRAEGARKFWGLTVAKSFKKIHILAVCKIGILLCPHSAYCIFVCELCRLQNISYSWIGEPKIQGCIAF